MLVKSVVTLALIIAIPIMALSRVYLGAHTLNEVLHGTLIGSTLALIGHYKVRPIVMRFNSMLATQSETYNVRLMSYVLVDVITFGIPMSLACLTLYMRYDDTGKDGLYESKEWLQRMRQSGCNAETLDRAIILHYRHFEHAAVVAIATGAFYG